MALYQSELAKNNDMRKSAATAGSRKKMSVIQGEGSHLMSYVTLENPNEQFMNLDGGSF